MGWALKAPADMRIFQAVTAAPIPHVSPVGTISKDHMVEVGALTPVTYDHHYRPALPFSHKGRTYFLLIEEIGEDVTAAAYNWTSSYEQSRMPDQAKTAKETAAADAEQHQRAIIGMLRRHFRTTTLRVVA